MGGTDVCRYEHCTRQFGGQCHNGVVDRTADATSRRESAHEGALFLRWRRLQNRVEAIVQPGVDEIGVARCGGGKPVNTE